MLLNAATTADTLTGATTVGKALVKAADTAAARVAISAPAVADLPTADTLSGATTVGKAVVKATDTAAARTAISAVGKGDLVFNVKDYGAVCDWTGSGTTGTVNNTAINACFDAAVAAGSSNLSGPSTVVTVPAGTGVGYVINDTITVPQNVELDMQAPFVYTGPSGRPALMVGTLARVNPQHRRHKLRVTRYTPTDWSSEADAGIVISNYEHAVIDIRQCSGFTVGCVFIGSGYGFDYNEVHLGDLFNNKIGVDVTNDAVSAIPGWANENHFYGGAFRRSLLVNPTVDIIGVRITSRAGTPYPNNSNYFHKPSFELCGNLLSGSDSTIFLVQYGNYNRIVGARHETNSPQVFVQQNDSTGNRLDFGYAEAFLPVLNSGTSSSGIITSDTTAMTDGALRTIYKVDNIHQRACYYDGATKVNVPGLTARPTSGVNARAISSGNFAASYLESTGSDLLGFYMSTRVLKQFTIFRDVEAGFGGRVKVIAYDNTGTVISNVAGTVVGLQAVNSPTWTSLFGGAWQTGSDSTGPVHLGVSAATDYVFIGVNAGSAALRIRALSVATLQPVNPATWLGFPDDGKNYGTAAPTAGTWAVGREVTNVAPGASVATKWVCTTAGTPGTWLALIPSSTTVNVYQSFDGSLPTGAVAQTFPRHQATTGATAAASGRLGMSAVPLVAGNVVTSITFFSSSQALAGGAHGWAALYTPGLLLCGQSVDDTSITWAINTAKTFTLTASYTVPTTGYYYVGYMTVGTTQQTLVGTAPATVVSYTPPVLGGWSTSSLTTTAPSTASALASSNACPYAYVS